MSKWIGLSLVAVLAVVFTVKYTVAEDAAAPKYSVKDVMKTAMKGGLCKKVASGDASAEETKQLIELLESMAAAKVAKGDADSWKEKTSALVAAAKGVAAGTDGAGAKLAAAANCAACHKVHK